jgi:acyl-CoA synthetase (AMP-forming)/AMP-acid ligase II
MTHPSVHARTEPDKIAYQMAGSGKAISYRELDELSNQGAQLFRFLGLKAGDHVAFLIENRLAFMEICWAAQRSGLYYTAIRRSLTRTRSPTSSGIAARGSSSPRRNAPTRSRDWSRTRLARRAST